MANAKLARPRKAFDRATWETALKRMAAGELLNDICADPEMPHPQTIRGWAVADATLGTEYARARDLQAHALAESALREAMCVTDPTQAQLARLRWDAVRWHVSKIAPKHYSDKAMLEHSGPGGGPLTLRWASEAEMAAQDKPAESTE